MLTPSNTRRSAVVAATIAASLLTAPFGQAQDARITAANTTAQATADIEEIPKQARATALEIGNGNINLDKTNVGLLARGMADAIISKPAPADPSSTTDPNRAENKADEIGEVAANITEAISANRKFKKPSTATGIILTLLQNVLKTARTTTEIAATSVIRDVVGSVALTIKNDATSKKSLDKAIQKFLLSKAKKIAGAANIKNVKTGLKNGFSSGTAAVTANRIYEDGNRYDELSAISDPETDKRPI